MKTQTDLLHAILIHSMFPGMGIIFSTQSQYTVGLIYTSLILLLFVCWHCVYLILRHWDIDKQTCCFHFQHFSQGRNNKEKNVSKTAAQNEDISSEFMKVYYLTVLFFEITSVAKSVLRLSGIQTWQKQNTCNLGWNHIFRDMTLIKQLV